jgi:hypothetical protein
MKVTKRFLLICSSLLFFSSGLESYHLPALSLGATNILAGGPLIPVKGWYWLPYLINYNTTKLLDAHGKLVGGVPSPHFNGCSIINQFVYQSELKIAKAKLGFNFVLPVIVSAHVEKNNLGVTSSGGGLGDVLVGMFLQWKEVKIGNESGFITRVACDASFPTGKNEQPMITINPGNNFYSIRSSWSATLYFTQEWASSWSLYYLWNSTNRATCIKAGDTMFANYDIEYQLRPKLWVAFTGYFLQQFRDSRFMGQDIPESRERILGSGCGFLYTTRRRFHVLSYVYFESLVRNHAQGIRFVFRLVKHF